jgi:glucans biosynthesis protein C
VQASRDGPLCRYLTKAVFMVCILRRTMLMVLALTLLPTQLNLGVEGALLVLGTLAISLIGFELIRRLTWVRPLFGLAGKSRF